MFAARVLFEHGTGRPVILFRGHPPPILSADAGYAAAD